MANLNGLCVVVTRPSPQGERLCAAIDAEGGRAVHFPTIEIMPPTNVPLLKEQLSHLIQFDWLIFISPQAVYQAAPYISHLPKEVKVAAVGQGTAKVLQDMNLPVHVFPHTEWSSEGLLKVPEFQTISGQKIGLVRGEGGRELLTHELSARGADVIPIIAYRRHMPKVRDQDLSSITKGDILVCTSADGLRNVVALGGAKILHIPVIVISERMKLLAAALQFHTILLAENASDDAIINVLRSRTVTMNNQTETKKTSKKPWGNIGILLSGFAIVVLLLMGGVAGSRLLAANDQLAAMVAQLKQQMTQSQKNLADIQQTTQQNNDALKTQDHLIAELRESQHTNRDTLRVAEAEFWIKVANNNLQFENNVALAVKFMQAADQELSELTDPNIVPLRKALGVDLAALQSVAQVDVTGVYARISGVDAQIEKLPLLSRQITPPSATATAADLSQLPWWKRGLITSWQAIKQIVIVRHHTKEVPPYVAPEQQAFLYLNLHAELAQAQWALLHQNADIYRTSLQQAIDWIKSNFVTDAAATQQVVASLVAFQQVNVHPAVPAITGTLQAMQNYFTASNNGATHS